MTTARGRLRDDVLLEWYRYPPGPAVALPGHAHEEYQLNLNLTVPGGVRYRGAYHVVPPGGLGVLMPGETHTPRDPEPRDAESIHLTLYVRTVPGCPFFRDPVVTCPDLVRRFTRLHATLTGAAPALVGDVRLVTLLTDLAERHGGTRPLRTPPAHRAVRLAREYLHDHRTENVSLAELAAVSGLSPYHLTRVFTAGVGLPPHAYQLQLRIELAKRLLLAGRSVTDAGHEVGFFDTSHFTRHFKKHVGVAPGRYAR